MISEIYKQIRSCRLPVAFHHLRTSDGREIDLLLELEGVLDKHSLERNSRIAWWLQQTGRLQMHKLITHVVRPEDAPSVYESLATRKDEYVGVVFDWS